MTGTPPKHAAPPAGLAGRLWGWLVDGLASAGTLLIGVLMFIICADIVARNVFGGSLPLISELGALALVMIVYLQLATTARHDRLVRADLFLSVWSSRYPRFGLVLELIFDITAAVVLGLLAWATRDILFRDFSAGEYIGVTGVLTLPTWPFRAAILLGLAVATLQFVFSAIGRLRRLAAASGDAP